MQAQRLSSGRVYCADAPARWGKRWPAAAGGPLQAGCRQLASLALMLPLRLPALRHIHKSFRTCASLCQSTTVSTALSL